MAIDAFLFFNSKGIDKAFVIHGETQDLAYKTGGTGGAETGALEINSYSFGVENIAAIGSKSGGAGAGKANFDNFEITKNVDASSTAIFAACTQGAHYDEVSLHLRRSGGEDNTPPYIKFKFKLVFLTGVKWSGSGDDVPEETITFAYGAFLIEYSKQNSEGKIESTNDGRWSQVLNKATEEVT